MRVSFRRVLLVLIWLGSTLAGEGVAQSRTTVCDLARHPLKYVSRRVEVYGEIRGGLDRLLLSDRSCRRRPVAISISNDAVGRPDVAPLWSAIYREGNIGTVGKRITATVVGTFSYERGEWPGGVRTVEGVRNLEGKHLPAGS